MWPFAVQSPARHWRDTNVDFAVAARPLWLVFAGVGVLIFALGVYSTSGRALRSAEKLAPLIAGADPRQEAAGVA